MRWGHNDYSPWQTLTINFDMIAESVVSNSKYNYHNQDIFYHEGHIKRYVRRKYKEGLDCH